MFKYVILVNLVFVSLYFETINFYGVKIGQLWKIIFLYVLLIILFKNKEKIVFFGKIEQTLFLYFFWPLVISCAYIDEIGLSISLIRFLLFLFTTLVFNAVVKFKNPEKFIIVVSTFGVLSFFPFFFGYLTSLGFAIDLSKFSDTDKYSLVGIFQNPHSASLFVSICGYFLFVLSFRFKSSVKKTIILIGFFLSIIIQILTGVRSGLLLTFSATFVYIFFQNIRQIVLYLMSLILVCFFSYVLYVCDVGVYYFDKLIGVRKYFDTFDVYNISSGRNMLWYSSIQIFIKKYDFFEKITGTGYGEFTDYIGEIYNIKVFAHNIFLNELLMFGFVGFLIFLYLVFNLYKFSHNFKKQSNKSAYSGLMVGLLSYGFFQGLDYLPHMFLVPIFIKYLIDHDQSNKFLNVNTF